MSRLFLYTFESLNHYLSCKSDQINLPGYACRIYEGRAHIPRGVVEQKPWHHILMIENQDIRRFIAVFLDETFAPIDAFGDDIFTTKVVYDMFLAIPTPLETWTVSLADFQGIMAESGLEGDRIPGTTEKLWRIKLKG